MTGSISSWGNQRSTAREILSEDLGTAARGQSLTRGLGRSYGDASLPVADATQVASSLLADRILSFDRESGLVRVEAGLSLEQMSRIFLPLGWFTPVSPGTQFVTVGGMVASDVHGKNHHVAGTIGRHVRSLRVQRADGRVVECSREKEVDLFQATLGGMGLTGHILEVEFTLERVPSPWIARRSWRMPDLETLLHRLKDEGTRWPMTAAWIDTIARRRGQIIGRGVLYAGRWAEGAEAPRRPAKMPFGLPMPVSLPSGLLNRFTIAQFNRLVYAANWRRERRDYVSALQFFYPLDRVAHWNRAYGSRGVTQHQCVIPVEHGVEGIRELLEVLARTGASSLLTVVKDCGAEGDGVLSFPRPGMSVALDIPVRSDTQRVVDELNRCVMARGGRIYLTKDGYTRAEDFATMEGDRLARFLEIKRCVDPRGVLESRQSRRLLTPTPSLSEASPRSTGQGDVADQLAVSPVSKPSANRAT